jgi:deoxyribodipyrimidine photo-lyase
VASSLKDVDKRSFLNELIWREFNYHTLWDHPKILSAPFKSKWAEFPWAEPPDHLDAWKQGRTGYPVVDAAARQLLATGFVHNRARMVAASFLTKHLMLDFRLGEDHYLRWLVDGDWAQNCMGWQWAAGCGADAQPWFRIFNPVTQGKKFDPDGTYVRQWVPELRALDKRYIHAPWSAPPQVLERAKIQLGVEYPRPVVDHAWARERFLSTAKTFFSGDESPATTPPPRQEKAVPRQGRLFDMRVDGADLGRGKTEGDKDGWSPSRGWGKKAETEAPP